MTKRFEIKTINKAQEDFLTSSDNIQAYIGGLGSGKTHIGADKTLLRRLEYPEAWLLVAANSYRQLESATLPKFISRLDSAGIRFDYHKQEKTIKLRLPGFEKGIIHFRSLENYEDLRGVEFLDAWIDEARDTTRTAFDVVLGRVRQRIAARDFTYNGVAFAKGQMIPDWVNPFAKIPLAQNQIRITSTPDMLKAKWLYQILHDPIYRGELEKVNLTVREFKARSKDNPYLPPDYLSMLTTSYDNEMAQQELEGEWILIPPGKPVYKGIFSSDLHLQKLSFNKTKPVILGIDWGFHHPASVICQEDSAGRLCVLKEVLAQDIDTEGFVELIIAVLNQKYKVAGKELEIEAAYCDPAGKQSSSTGKTDFQAARNLKIPLISKKSFINDGVKVIQRRMTKIMGGSPGLVIDPDGCPVLVEGFRGGYHYPARTDEFRAEKITPFKDGKYEHVMDALRYVCINRYGASDGVLKKPNNPSNYTILDESTGY